MQPDQVLVETVASVKRVLGTDIEHIFVERAVIGLFFTGVKLSTGFGGASATPLRSIPEAVCCPSSAMAMPFPGKLRGRLAKDLLKEIDAASGIRRAVGVAVVNALAAMCWERTTFPDVELKAGVDAYDAAEIATGEHVVVVGAFIPFLKALKRAGHHYTVLEIDAATLKPGELPHFCSADKAASVLPAADVVLITGTTLLNSTLNDLLALCRPRARVVMVGPTVTLVPDAFVRRGVDVLGGIRITAPNEFLDILAEGGSGYHFFGRSAEKVVLVRQAAAARQYEASVVDLKFLPRLQQPREELQIRNHTRKQRFASVPLIPKFASGGAASTCELRNWDTSGVRATT